MARTPRPVNPGDGPIAAFAFELRALRDQAGNPTYRALAKIAGFSATTLGEAAGGVRLPTLEVTLAYVGACGGDQHEWRERWRGVRGLLDASADADGGEARDKDAEEEEPGVFVAEDVTSAVSGERAGPVSGRRFARPVLVLAGVICVLMAVLFAWVGRDMVLGRSARPAVAAQVSATSVGGCPAPNLRGASFTGTTYGIGVNVRAGASLSAVVRLRVPPGCTLGFSGYCLGDVVQDETAGTPDMRWFISPGLGEVASGLVHGNPPAGLAPGRCPDDVPAPASIALSISPATGSGGGVQLVATGSQIWIVGFAAEYGKGGTGSAPAWHQVGLSALGAGPDFKVSFQPPVPATTAAGRPGAGIPIVAVACLGGDSPTAVLAAVALDPLDGRATAAPPQSPAALADAEQAACQYPSG